MADRTHETQLSREAMIERSCLEVGPGVGHVPVSAFNTLRI